MPEYIKTQTVSFNPLVAVSKNIQRKNQSFLKLESMKFVFFTLSALLVVQYAYCLPNEMDKKCALDSTGVQGTSASVPSTNVLHSTLHGVVGTSTPNSPSATLFRTISSRSWRRTTPGVTQTGTVHSTSAGTFVTSAPSQLAALDIKHVYRNGYGKETVEKRLRVILRRDEAKWVYLRAYSNSYSDPRALYVHFDGIRVLATIASHSVWYNSILVETSHEWSCVKRSLKKGHFSYEDFSTYSSYRESSGFRVYTDWVEIRVLTDDVPLGPSKDLECFGKQFPLLKRTSKTGGVRVNLTKMYFKQVGVSKWCCRDVEEESTVIDLKEGLPKTVSLKYVSITDSIVTDGRDEMKSVFRDENPRNLTLLFHGGILYAGMAKLEESAYHTGKYWLYDSSWKCVNITVATKITGPYTRRRLDFFSYYSNAGPVTTIQKRTDYVFLKVIGMKSRAGLVTSSIAVLIAALAVAFVLSDKFAEVVLH